MTQTIIKSSMIKTLNSPEPYSKLVTNRNGDFLWVGMTPEEITATKEREAQEKDGEPSAQE